MTLLDLFDGARAERANARAVNGLPYAGLHAASLRVAACLAERGLGRGDRIALYCENRMGFVFAYLAALRLGAIVVPVNASYRLAELEHVLDDADVACVIAGEVTHAAAAQTGRATIDAARVENWASEDAPESGASSFTPREDDPALILYTSGTTGRSKGAVLTHGNVAAIAAQVATAWRWTARDTLYVALPLFHMHGLGAALNGTLCAGAHLIFDERFDAQRALERLHSTGATMFFGVPTMYVRLLAAAERTTAPLPQLRLWVSGSAALAPDVFEAFRKRFGAEILERYGATEFGFACSNRFGGPRVAGSVGIPTPGTRVRVVATGDGTEPLDANEVGELLVAGPGVFAGYWRNAEATAVAFARDGEGTRWYRSGDLAQYDAAHDVYRIVGRLKDLIITGGFNVYPLEIENELNRLPGVAASAVVGIPDAERGEIPVAYVEPAPDRAGTAPCDPATLLAALAERLAGFKVPREIVVVEALPRNAMGKVEKHRLAAAHGGATFGQDPGRMGS